MERSPPPTSNNTPLRSRKIPCSTPSLPRSWTCRAWREIQISPEQAIALADTVDPFLLSARRAFVATNDLQRHPARMQQILRSPCKTIGIFDTMAEPEAWVPTSAGPLPSTGGAQVVPFPSRFRL
jgi:hypothetical protein